MLWFNQTDRGCIQTCKIICEKYPENDAYRALLGCIDADKGKALTEPEGFAKMLEKASEMLVDCL